MAALFTSTSSDPNRSTVASTQRRAASGSPTLAACQATSPASVSIDAAASASASALRDDSITSGAGLGEPGGDGPADPARAPGDQGHLAVEPEIHGATP